MRNIKFIRPSIILLMFSFLLASCKYTNQTANSQIEVNKKQNSFDKNIKKDIKQRKLGLKKLSVSEPTTPFTKLYTAKTSVGTFDICGANIYGYRKNNGTTDQGFILYYTYHNTTKKKHELQAPIIHLLNVKRAKLFSISIKGNKSGEFLQDFPVYQGMDETTRKQDLLRHNNGNKEIQPGKSALGTVAYSVKGKESKKGYYKKPYVQFELKADSRSSAIIGEMNIPIYQLMD